MTGFAIKIKSKSNQYVEKGLTAKSTVHELKSRLENLTGISVVSMNVLSGFPPKPLDLNNLDATLEEVGVNSGETLIVQANPESSQKPLPVEPESSSGQIMEASMVPNNGILLRKVVPSDNSCLFTSIDFVLGDSVKKSSHSSSHSGSLMLYPQIVRKETRKITESTNRNMRQIIANAVLNDPKEYTEAILGKSTKDYSEWITKPETWGGAIEIRILSQHYGIEISVVDTINGIINNFGEDKNYQQRVILIFDGIHYDPLFMEDPSTGMIQTIFPKADNLILKLATELAQEAKSSRQYTDIYKFTLRCGQCERLFNGSREAQDHATLTGHTRFGEIN